MPSFQAGISQLCSQGRAGTTVTGYSCVRVVLTSLCVFGTRGYRAKGTVSFMYCGIVHLWWLHGVRHRSPLQADTMLGAATQPGNAATWLTWKCRQYLALPTWVRVTVMPSAIECAHLFTAPHANMYYVLDAHPRKHNPFLACVDVCAGVCACLYGRACIRKGFTHACLRVMVSARKTF